MHLTFPQGKGPVHGSNVTLFAPYGANGGGLGSVSPDVVLDNSPLSLPIQRNIVNVTQGDPVQGLSDLAYYCDARASVKTMPSGTDAESVAALAGSIASMDEVDAGDHFVWDSEAFGGVGGLVYQNVTQMVYTGFSTGSVHSLAMMLEKCPIL
jgi:hypothetical protein